MTVPGGTVRGRGRRRIACAFAAVCTAATCGLLSAPVAEAERCRGKGWVSAWINSPGGPSPQRETFAGDSLRLRLRPVTDGSRARIRLSNRFGDAPAIFKRVHVGVAPRDASIRGRNLPIRFDDSRSVRIPPGREVTSDPFRLQVRRFRPLAVSIDVAGRSRAVATGHRLGHQVSYLAPDTRAAAEASGTAYSNTTRTTSGDMYRYFVTRIDVIKPRRAGGLISLGDSITDGVQAFPDEDDFPGTDQGISYPALLARQLTSRRRESLAVLNAGIGGNQILARSLFSPSALERLEADVLSVPGVRASVIALGVNDLIVGRSASAVIGGLRELINRLQAGGVEPIVATITPGGGFMTDEENQARIEVNAWIRGSAGVPVADFDQALRDPSRPRYLLPAYDSGDGLHPNTDGYRRIAETVPLGAVPRGCAKR